MLSSQQVAMMMGQQQQMFTGMQQYSQIISAQMPQPMVSTIGNYGQAQPMPQYAQIPYAPRQQPGFSYGGGSFGYGMGNQMGAAGVAGMAGAGQFALGGLGIAGGLGLLGKTGGMMFDPMSAGMAGFSAARGMGMGMMGGLGMGAMAAGVVAAPMMMAQHALGSMVTGAQEQAGVNQALGGFNFSNSMSRTGKGFSRQDAMAIGSMTRELQAIPEMMTSMSELTRIMDRMGQSGMMNGVRDASEFSKKFKETIHTLKDVSKMMGSTMEEAMQAFQESKQSGFYSPQAIKQNIMQKQIVGGLTGMNQGQVTQMQMYGAEVSKSYGGSRAGGARSISRIAGELGMANQAGMLSNDELMEMTGSEGAEGIQKLAGSLNDVGQRMGRSSLGTAMTLALGETKDGRYTGNMDKSLVERVRSGEISKSELLKLAHQKSAGRNAKLSFAAHRQRLTTEMVNSAGVQGISMELGEILGERGFDNPDALNLVMQRYGANEEQATHVIGMMKKMPEIQRGMAGAGTAEARRMAEQAFMKENASWEGISKKIGKKFENVFTEPFKKMGASIANSIGESIDTFVDDIFGRYQTKVTELASSTVLKASLGDKKAMARMSAIKGDIAKQSGRGADLTNSNLIGGLIDSASGQQTAGEVTTSILTGLGKDRFYGSTDASNAQIVAGGNLALGDGKYATRAGMSNAARVLKSGKNRFEDSIGAAYAGGDKTLLKAGKALEETLLNDEELKGDLTDQQKYEIIKKKMGYGSNLEAHTAGSKTLLDQIKSMDRFKGAGDIEIIDALQKATGSQSMKTAMSMMGLAGGIDPNAGNLRELSKRRGEEVKAASGKFRGKEAEAASVIGAGGGAAKLLSAAFGEGGTEIQKLLMSKDGTKLTDEQLSKLGMTQKEFDAAKDQAAGLVSAGRSGGASGSDIGKVLNTDLLVADASFKESARGVGSALTDRIKGADVGGLSKAGQGLAARLGELGKNLTDDKGFGDTGDLLASLADYTGKDKSKLLSLAGGELGAGVHEIELSRRSMKRSRKNKVGDTSVDAYLEKMGLKGDEATSAKIRELAGGGKSSDIDANEAKAIEKLLGDASVKSLTAGKGGTKNDSVNAAQSLSKTLETMNKNAEATAQILQTLVKPSGVTK